MPTQRRPVLRILGWIPAALTLAAPAVLRAQGPDDDAFKRVIRAETEAFYARNADAWQATWLHDAKATRTLVGNGSYSAVRGWDAFGPAIVQGIRQNPTPVRMQLQSDNYVIRSAGTLAWVEYDQRITAPGDSAPYVSHEQRALVRQDGQWKIASQVTEDVGSFGATPLAVEGSLNATGYTLLRANKAADAVEVFKLTVQLFPKSWNAYDSLGEAYAAAGDKAQAIQSYERSLALNPASESGRQALAKLRAGTR